MYKGHRHEIEDGNELVICREQRCFLDPRRSKKRGVTKRETEGSETKLRRGSASSLIKERLRLVYCFFYEALIGNIYFRINSKEIIASSDFSFTQYLSVSSATRKPCVVILQCYKSLVYGSLKVRFKDVLLVL